MAAQVEHHLAPPQVIPVQTEGSDPVVVVVVLGTVVVLVGWAVLGFVS